MGRLTKQLILSLLMATLATSVFLGLAYFLPVAVENKFFLAITLMVLFIGTILSYNQLLPSKYQDSNQFKLLVQNSPEAMILHSQGIIVFVNEAAIKLFGAKKKEDLLGKHAVEFVSPPYQKMVKGRIKSLMTGTTQVNVTEEQFITIDGKIIDVDVMGAVTT